MARDNRVFEVQTHKVDHWVLDCCLDSEESARAYAKMLLATNRAEGVRIVKDWARPDGRHVETEILTEFRTRASNLTLAPIDEAPAFCHTMTDVYAIDARLVMGRLLKSYVERLVVTPNEILHNYPEMKRLLDRDNLLPMAVGRVAALQAEKAGTDGRARRDELFEVVNALAARARSANARSDLPDIGSGGFSGAVRRLENQPAEERCFLANVILARDLVQMRNWVAKLDFLGEIARENGGLTDDALVPVDAALADVLTAPSVAQELLGAQPCLADALCSLIDLSKGRLAPQERSETDRAVGLNELFAFCEIRESRRAVIDLVRRQLKGTHPLHRADPSAERDAFLKVLYRAATADGVIGGGAMAEALVARGMRFLEAGGATGRRQAIADIVDRFPDAKDSVRFLMALATSDVGRMHADDVAATLVRITGDPSAVGRFVQVGQPIKANLVGLTVLHAQVSDSDLPPPLRSEIANNVDRLLVAYIVNSRVVERLDDPLDLLRHRANRLMQLCAPGTLRSDKALAMVRQRVIAHLRQPNFEARYIEDIADPLLQQKALRDFYRLLGQAGFR